MRFLERAGTNGEAKAPVGSSRILQSVLAAGPVLSSVLTGCLTLVVAASVTFVGQSLELRRSTQSNLTVVMKSGGMMMSRRVLADRLDTLRQTSDSQMIGNLDVTKAAKADRMVGVVIDEGRKASADSGAPAPTRSENIKKSAKDAANNGPQFINHDVYPRLIRDPGTGELMINSFDTMAFPANSNSCRQLGESILQDVKAPRTALQVLAESRLISVLRICANNGSVVLSCRNGNATISPRRLRPDDGCLRQKPT